MPRVKQASKQRRVTKAMPALGAAGLTFSLVANASAAVAPATDESQTPNYSPNHQITLGDEEIADIWRRSMCSTRRARKRLTPAYS
jgi:hypothetical protein